MNGNSKGGLPRWITAEGTIDLAELAIDGILKQAIDPESERFRSGCALCLVKTKSTFEINNLKKRDVTMLHAIWLGEITIRHGQA